MEEALANVGERATAWARPQLAVKDAEGRNEGMMKDEGARV